MEQNFYRLDALSDDQQMPVKRLQNEGNDTQQSTYLSAKADDVAILPLLSKCWITHILLCGVAVTPVNPNPNPRT